MSEGLTESASNSSTDNHDERLRRSPLCRCHLSTIFVIIITSSLLVLAGLGILLRCLSVWGNDFVYVVDCFPSLVPQYVIFIKFTRRAPFYVHIKGERMRDLPYLHEPDLPVSDNDGKEAGNAMSNNLGFTLSAPAASSSALPTTLVHGEDETLQQQLQLQLLQKKPQFVRNDSLLLRRAVVFPAIYRINISWISRWQVNLEYYIYDVSKTLEVNIHEQQQQADNHHHRATERAAAKAVAALNSSSIHLYDVPVNKGNEAMAYLSFIIDNYANLPDRMLFIHGHEKSWHQSHIDGVLSSIRWEVEGYHNLKCITGAKVDSSTCKPGTTPAATPKTNNGVPVFVDYWRSAMAPNGFGPVPKWVASPCCAQFLVSKSAVLKNKIEVYTSIRDWITTVSLNDSTVSGWVLEHAWHIIFTRNHVLCPRSQSCYCELYGLCKAKASPVS